MKRQTRACLYERGAALLSIPVATVANDLRYDRTSTVATIVALLISARL